MPEEMLRIFPLTIYKAKIGLAEEERNLLVIEQLTTPVHKWLKF